MHRSGSSSGAAPPPLAIVATTSEQAYDPSPDLYYAQTKAATMNYVKSLAKQLASKGIRVNRVAPRPVWTPLQVSGGATMGAAGEVRRPNVTGPARTTGGARLDLCSTRHRGCKLCDRSGLRVVRGSGAALIILVTSSFFLRSPLRPSAELSRPHRNAYAGSRRAGCLFPNKVSRRRLHCSAFTHWEIHRIFGIPETASMVPLDAPAHAALAGLPPAASAPTARSSSTNCAYAARLSASAGRRRSEEG